MLVLDLKSFYPVVAFNCYHLKWFRDDECLSVYAFLLLPNYNKPRLWHTVMKVNSSINIRYSGWVIAVLPGTCIVWNHQWRSALSHAQLSHSSIKRLNCIKTLARIEQLKKSISVSATVGGNVPIFQLIDPSSGWPVKSQIKTIEEQVSERLTRVSTKLFNLTCHNPIFMSCLLHRSLVVIRKKMFLCYKCSVLKLEQQHKVWGNFGFPYFLQTQLTKETIPWRPKLCVSWTIAC